MNDTVAILALQLTAGAGHVTVNRIAALARSLEVPLGELVAMPARRLHEALPPGAAGLAEPLVAARRTLGRAKSLVERAWGRGADFVAPGDDGYPACATAYLGRSAPPLLALRGNAGLLSRPLAAVVGTRAPSSRGAVAAEECARLCCRAGAGVISGGADGVDTAAHGAAVAAGGDTVVVLPQGILTYAPPLYLVEAMEQGRALLVSSFSPDAPWQTHAAVTRNDLIAALARVVCVVEPRKTGGSVRTGRRGLEQRKPVFCLSGHSGGGTGLAGAATLAGTDGAIRADALVAALAAPLPPPVTQAELWT